MAKKQSSAGENKSAFIRNALTKDPNRSLEQINQLWARAGHAGEITGSLFYAVKRKMGIKSEYRWMIGGDGKPNP